MATKNVTRIATGLPESKPVAMSAGEGQPMAAISPENTE